MSVILPVLVFRFAQNWLKPSKNNLIKLEFTIRIYEAYYELSQIAYL